MRAACQHCAALQPSDWAPGHLCIACGKAVRSDVRCFWCAKWTPQAKFCRSCGAEIVAPEHYGAARMIKDAGTDRFTVPKMLTSLDPEQVETFTRIYNAQAGLVARHVDEVRFVQGFLFHQGYADELEETLIPELPWPEAKQRLMLRDPQAGTDLERVRHIAETSPFDLARSLATLARLGLGDLVAVRDAGSIFRGAEGPLRIEAAMALTSWRLEWTVGLPRDGRAELIAALRGAPFPREAAVRLALLGAEVDDALLKSALDADRETAFTAALALGDVDRLQAALQGEALERRAAGSKLIELGLLEAVVEPIRKSTVDVQTELVASALRREGPLPELGDALLEIVETTEDETLRERAARALCRSLRPEWALRIARRAQRERYIYQSLLSESAALPSEAIEGVVDQMLETGMFSMSQYGLKEAGARGAIRDDFVPRRLAAASPEIRMELIRMAEAQLEARADPALERSLYGVVFGEHPAEVRAAAWWALHRVYRRSDVRGEGPLRLEPASLEAMFGTVERFLVGATRVLEDHATLKEVGVFDFLARLFGSAEPTFVVALSSSSDAADRFVRALLAAAGGDYWVYLVDAMIKLLGQVGVDPRWREDVIAGLEGLGRAGSYHYDKALETLRASRPSTS